MNSLTRCCAPSPGTRHRDVGPSTVHARLLDPGVLLLSRSPWQRPTNENTNGLLRQYFPKGRDLAGITTADLRRVEHQLNNGPRRTLNWKTPAQRLAHFVRRPPETA